MMTKEGDIYALRIYLESTKVIKQCSRRWRRTSTKFEVNPFLGGFDICSWSLHK